VGMNSAAQPSILVDDSDAYYCPLLAYARVGDSFSDNVTSVTSTCNVHSDPPFAELLVLINVLFLR